MSVSFKPAAGTLATVTPGTPVQANDALPDNCHTLILFNTSSTDVALIGWAQDSASFDPTTAVRVASGTSITLAISASSGRSHITGDEPFYDLTGGAVTDLEITYVNGASL